MNSLIIPVYKNEANLDRLIEEMEKLCARSEDGLEIVFVVDGSPDRCHELLAERLPRTAFRSQLLLLSRNFGSFAAVTAGLEAAEGDNFAVLAADLQEPPELAEEFFRILSGGQADVVFGTRDSRSDPALSEVASNAFWSIYRRFVIKDMPRGGVDVFGCNRVVRDRLLGFRENNSNLIALLFWMGHRRAYVPYGRRAREAGKSAWTFRKKLKYCFDSIFNFTNLPIQLLLYAGGISLALSILGGLLVLSARLLGHIHIPGYTPIVLAIFFFGALTSLGLGILGQYLWLTLQNTRGRPNYLVSYRNQFADPSCARAWPVEEKIGHLSGKDK